MRDQLLEALPDAVFVVAQQGEIVFVNAQAERLFGYTRDQLVGQPIEMLVPDAIRQVHPTHRARYFGEPQVRPMGAGLDLSGRRADGAEFPCEISLSAIETAEGRLVTAVVRDVSERRQTQAKFQGLLEAAPDAMVGVDSRGRIKIVNTQTERLFGYDRTELLGNPIEVLVPQRARDVHPMHRQLYFSDPQFRPMGAGNELFGLRKDGTEFPAEISLSSIETEDGILVTAAVRDVTERKAFELMVERARDTAERAARARQDFLANMSHEIRTPMNAVIGMTSLLLDSALSEEQRDYVETVRSSGDHLLTIINDILDYAKIDSGKVVLDEVPFGLWDWLEECIDLIASQASERGLELVLDVADDVPSVVLGDVGRLRQVLINVLSNAVKFTRSGEVAITVSVGASPDAARDADPRVRLQVQVRDTGVGISPERMAILFDPFTQADTTTTREYGGTGLGLAISRRLMELMDGSIEMQSAPGMGTTVLLSLVVPVVEPAASPTASAGTEALAGRSLLVVDDNATNLRVLAEWAERRGMHVLRAASAMEALAFDELDIFAALVDHTLPGWDGVRLGHQLRARLPEARLLLLSPAGLMSRDDHPGVFDTVLAKPLKFRALEHALVTMVGQPPGTPLAPAEAEPSAFALKQSARLSILVVEDNPVNQKVARHLLARFGCRADVASSGAEALQALERRGYDLVLMDVQMPEMDGLEATRQIRARWPETGPRVVAMTANVSQTSITSCITAGMDGFLGKPIVVAELAALLEDVAKAEIDRPRPDPSLPPAVDRAVLDRLGTEIGEGAVRELVGMYLRDAAGSAESISVALEAEDRDTLMQVAHRLRSASRTLGATHLSEVLSVLEELAPVASFGELSPLAVAALAEISRARDEFGGVLT
jgi:two-component system sensor histidine kinase/response regulator